jgi:hypothetical protein
VPLNSLRRAWDRFWFERIDPHSAGVFRIFLGATLVVYYLALFPNWDRYYAADGLLSLDLLDPERSYRPWWSVFTWTEGLVPAGALWWVVFAAAVLFTLGLATRLCTVVLFVIHNSMAHTNSLMLAGDDLVFRMLLFFGCFAPLDRSLSLDAWLRARRRAGSAAGADEWPTAWAVRLMQVNIALVYLCSLPRKLVNAPWQDGTAIYWSLVNPTWSRWPWPGAFTGFPGEMLSAALTYGTLAVEAAFPVLVWFPRTRVYVLVAGAAMHLFIAAFIRNVEFFSLAMVCSYWLFVPGEVTRGWVDWLTGRAGSGRGTDAG